MIEHIKNTRAFRSRNGTLSVLDVGVSCFPNYKSTEQPTTVNLLAWLSSSKYAKKVIEIRQLPKSQQGDLKSSLPAITPSGIFTRRSASALIQHSGLIQFDIDFQDNSLIRNFDQLKKEISKIENVAYCGLSVSGKGYWGLIPIAFPDKHVQHLETLYKFFNSWGIILDQKPKNVASLRGYSWDEDPYFNHAAKPLQLYEKAFIKKDSSCTCDENKAWLDVLRIIQIIEANHVDITTSYDAWFKIGCSLANTFGEHGRELYHRVSQFHKDYLIRKTDNQYDQCLKKGYSIRLATFFYHCKMAGIQLN